MKLVFPAGLSQGMFPLPRLQVNFPSETFTWTFLARFPFQKEAWWQIPRQGWSSVLRQVFQGDLYSRLGLHTMMWMTMNQFESKKSKCSKHNLCHHHVRLVKSSAVSVVRRLSGTVSSTTTLIITQTVWRYPRHHNHQDGADHNFSVSRLRWTFAAFLPLLSKQANLRKRL